MNVQFKSITELRAMLDDKLISASELTQESIKLAKKYKELNCFVTMNEEMGKKTQIRLILIMIVIQCLQESLLHKKIYFVRRV